MSEVVGKYNLLRKLAHGGMAEIFLAMASDAPQDAPPVVIKRIRDELAHDPRFVAMFLNEAQLAAHMHHPNVVRVIEFGEDQGRLFMAMEFVDGLDCWRFTKRSESWGQDHVGVAVFIIRRVLDALNYAHNMRDVNGETLRVVHRDLSPSNIYLSRAGEVKLGDFGIARVESERFRPVQIVPKGKFGYMAPEQVEGLPVDMRADVYSTGVVLSELLIREQLFTGTSQLTIMLDIRDGRLEQLERNAEKIPDGLRQILEGALARDRKDRYRTAAEFNEALAVYEQSMAHVVTPEEFAPIVATAADEGEVKDDTSSDISAIARAMAGEEVIGMQVTKPDGVTAVDAIITAAGETPITMDMEQQTGQGKYWARISDHSQVGPTAFAHVVELIYSDKITAGTQVSKDGREFLPANEFPELVRHLPVYTPVREEAEMSSLPKRRGVLDVETPANVLLTIASATDTGALVCERDGKRKEVYMRDGVAVYVGSNESGELLGEYLVEKEVIERTELEMALALLPKFHGHLGDTLIALGMLTAVELLQHISGQIRGRLEDLFTWQSGNYEFYDGVQVRKGVLEVQIDLVQFVREFLLDRMANVSGEKIFAELSGFKAAPTPLVGKLLDRLHLPESMDVVIRSLPAWTPVSELVMVGAGGPSEVGRFLFVAVESGLWTIDGPSIPWHDPTFHD